MLRPCCRKAVTIRSSSSATPAPASWPATACAPEAYAEAAFLSGRPEQSLMQLQALKRNPALDYIGRARVDARIEAITPPCWSCAARACRTGPGPPLSAA
jgi:hypothetical protein